MELIPEWWSQGLAPWGTGVNEDKLRRAPTGGLALVVRVERVEFYWGSQASLGSRKDTRQKGSGYPKNNLHMRSGYQPEGQ